jgi:hypothetical protein
MKKFKLNQSVYSERKPVDRVAARVIMPGEVHVPSIKLGDQVVYDAQPTLIPVPRESEDFTGRRRGDLTVVGFSHISPNQTGGQRFKWVCRCVCGRFVVRTGKTLRTEERGDFQDCCPYCHHERVVKVKDRAKQLKRYEDGSRYKEVR